MSARRALLVAVPLLVGACKYFRPIPPEGAEPEPAPEAAATPVPTIAPERESERNPGSLRDRNIAAMLLAQNNTDISYARLVPPRTERTDVKQFAERMLTDHTGVNALVTQLLLKLDMAPEDNVASLDMRDESASKRDLMRELTGFAFDSAYMTNEVRYHQRFLASIDNVMLPAARNEELKSLITTIRPAVAAHLAHAEQVWANVMRR